MTTAEAFLRHDLNDLINRLTAYAYDRLKTVGIKNFEGRQPCDIVADLLEKVLTGVRNFENASCSFPEFLFGCLKSDIDAFFKKKKYISDNELPERSASEYQSAKEEIAQYINRLSAEGADSDEILVFEALCDGIDKPIDIAELLEKDIKVIYNIKKKLVRRLQKIRTQLKITA